MAEPLSPAALEAEFDCLVARAGVTVPADRRAGSLAAYADFRAQLALLRGPRTHTAEPSNVFRLTPKAGA
ncbi:hypothetical protein [Limobrevibacterium gyesilva]|uniref:Uncharacterized protein n=1 Tax=Limobrevibacterium gyesilva TaxID=2991712 RepID=A0AA42CFV4_9PROT|nr:hypothetical protein [Limobrevibacterium gyesilva]MCW3475321.1 hypothetical protein [Limobrevibacterium gyesilva]